MAVEGEGYACDVLEGIVDKGGDTFGILYCAVAGWSCDEESTFGETEIFLCIDNEEFDCLCIVCCGCDVILVLPVSCVLLECGDIGSIGPGVGLCRVVKIGCRHSFLCMG